MTTNETRFTPQTQGPWEVKIYPGDRCAYIDAVGGGPIAHVFFGRTGDPAEFKTRNAHACLVAAAPSLYASLDRIQDAIQFFIEENRVPTQEVLLKWQADAREAIAQAKKTESLMSYAHQMAMMVVVGEQMGIESPMVVKALQKLNGKSLEIITEAAIEKEAIRINEAFRHDASLVEKANDLAKKFAIEYGFTA